jgi:hypothetical protein
MALSKSLENGECSTMSSQDLGIDFVGTEQCCRNGDIEEAVGEQRGSDKIDLATQVPALDVTVGTPPRGAGHSSAVSAAETGALTTTTQGWRHLGAQQSNACQTGGAIPPPHPACTLNGSIGVCRQAPTRATEFSSLIALKEARRLSRLQRHARLDRENSNRLEFC